MIDIRRDRHADAKCDRIIGVLTQLCDVLKKRVELSTQCSVTVFYVHNSNDSTGGNVENLVNYCKMLLISAFA
jgi:hypothetical protein